LPASAAPKRKLPSALDALSSGGSKPSFLQAGKESEFEVVELKERRLEAPEEVIWIPFALGLFVAGNVGDFLRVCRRQSHHRWLRR